MKTSEDKWMPRSISVYRRGKFAGTVTVNNSLISTMTEEEIDDFIYKHFPSN